jgi:hypothetical protein
MVCAAQAEPWNQHPDLHRHRLGREYWINVDHCGLHYTKYLFRRRYNHASAAQMRNTMSTLDAVSPSNWFKLITTQGVPAALLIVLVLLGATAFAKDLGEVKAQTLATATKVDDLNRHLELLIRINRQSCVNTSNGDRLAIAGCMVSE